MDVSRRCTPRRESRLLPLPVVGDWFRGAGWVAVLSGEGRSTQ